MHTEDRDTARSAAEALTQEPLADLLASGPVQQAWCERGLPGASRSTLIASPPRTSGYDETPQTMKGKPSEVFAGRPAAGDRREQFPPRHVHFKISGSGRRAGATFKA